MGHRDEIDPTRMPGFLEERGESKKMKHFQKLAAR